MKKKSSIIFRWKTILVAHTDPVLTIFLESTPNLLKD